MVEFFNELYSFYLGVFNDSLVHFYIDLRWDGSVFFFKVEH